MAYKNIMAGSEKQREEINRKLVSMQMEMIGLTYQDAMDTPEFWRVYTLTTEQTEAWRKLAIPLIKKTFKLIQSVTTCNGMEHFRLKKTYYKTPIFNCLLKMNGKVYFNNNVNIQYANCVLKK